MNHTDFLKLTIFLFLLFSKIEAQAQPSNNQLWKRDIQVSIGYPILNSLKTSKFHSQNESVEVFSSKKYPILEAKYSHRLVNKLNYSFGFSYYQNEVKGSEFEISVSPSNTSSQYYKLYQIIKSTDLRIIVLLSNDICFNKEGMIRASIGFGWHIYPQKNGDAELKVNNYYSDLQDSSITYFPFLAKNKYSYRHGSPITLPNPLVSVDIFRRLNNHLNIYIGLVFTYLFIPEDSDVNKYAVFESTNTGDYAINYNFKRQIIWGIHLGVNYHSKKIKPAVSKLL